MRKYSSSPVFCVLLMTGLLIQACNDKDEPSPQTEVFTIVEDVHHFIDFGTGENQREVTFTADLPEDPSLYQQVDLNIKLDCPSGGCDPWDRLASISVLTDTDTIEIARYITPYGVGCEWSTDVTPYRDLLSGQVRILSQIDTWVNSGWILSLELEYTHGESPFEKVVVENLWRAEYLVYGDPTQSVAQPQTNVVIPQDIANAEVRILITGHGQGNTRNGAEFLPREHKLRVNATEYAHDLWRTDCTVNPGCSPQNGNWTSSRAGWCPGKVAEPEIFAISNDVLPGSENTIEYKLQDYINECRPDNPDCNPDTCADCNYNNTGHTEPYYRISVQLINYY